MEEITLYDENGNPLVFLKVEKAHVEDCAIIGKRYEFILIPKEFVKEGD